MSNAIEKANWGAGGCPMNLATNRLLVEGDGGKEGLSWAEEEMRGKEEDWGIELWRREEQEGQGKIGYFNGIGLSSGLWGRSQSRERERFGGRQRGRSEMVCTCWGGNRVLKSGKESHLTAWAPWRTGGVTTNKITGVGAGCFLLHFSKSRGIS